MDEIIKLHSAEDTVCHILEQYDKHKNSEIERITGREIHLDNCSWVEGNNDYLELIYKLNVDGIEHHQGSLDTPYLCDVLYPITFSNSHLPGAFFHYVHFHGPVRFQNCEIGTCSFYKAKFDSYVYFDETTFKGNVNFEQCIFEDSLSLRDITILNALQPSFNNCVVNGNFDLTHIKIEKAKMNQDYSFSFSLRNSSFNGGLSLKKAHVDMDIYIVGCKVKDLDLSDITYHHKMTIAFVTLNGISMIDSQNHLSHIKEIELNNCIIEGDLHIQNYDFLQFEMAFCKIEAGNRMHILKSTFMTYKCLSSTIFGRLDMSDCIVKDEFTFDETSVSGEILLLGENEFPDLKDKYTAMLLKKESRKSANISDYLHFHSIEMNMMYREKCKSLRHNFFDVIALTFNKFSNNFGVSWFYGLTFTLVVSILFFHLINYFGTTEPIFEYGFTFCGFEDVLMKYMDTLNIFKIVNVSEHHSDLHLNVVGVILLYFAKILISYGLFQTGMAFRKYNRK